MTRVFDPRPVLVLGPFASVVAGFVSAGLVLLAGAAITRRWTR